MSLANFGDQTGRARECKTGFLTQPEENFTGEIMIKKLPGTGLLKGRLKARTGIIFEAITRVRKRVVFICRYQPGFTAVIAGEK